MKKFTNFKVLSDVKCSNKKCTNMLKANVVARRNSEDFGVCFKCHTKSEAIRGHHMNPGGKQ